MVQKHLSSLYIIHIYIYIYVYTPYLTQFSTVITITAFIYVQFDMTLWVNLSPTKALQFKIYPITCISSTFYLRIYEYVYARNKT